MRHVAALAVVVGLSFGLAGPSYAVLDTIEPTPAATLLIPYFEADFEQPTITTLFSIGNASASPVLAHVTFWTDLSVPTLDFDVYLTGYDIQTFNVRDIFVDGTLPSTGAAVSPVGPYSDANVNYLGCNNGAAPGEGPNYNNPAISAGFRNHLVNWHSGMESPITGNCAAIHHGDWIVRGYITIDVVNQCSLEFPSAPGYFAAAGSGVAGNDNVLWGDWFLVDPANNFAEAYTAVHIEADPTGAVYGPGDYTFYARYVAGTGVDGREGLATTLAARYANGGAFSGQTKLTAWRDSTLSQAAFACNTLPGWVPLDATEIVIFDEEEDVFAPSGCPSGDPTCTPEGVRIPYETQRLAVGGDTFPLPAGFEFGWIYLNLATNPAGGGIPGNPGLAQAWVGWSLNAAGQYQVGVDAIQLDNVANPNTILISAD